MFELNHPLILASGSPRRKEILQTMGLTYTVEVSDVDESCTGSPEKMVMELSARKAGAVAAHHDDALILAADTLVYKDGVLGKPADREDAIRMLTELSGCWHSVYTGLTLIDTHSGKSLSRAVLTRVHFVPLSAKEIEDYVATGEPLDKAGAYGIQGRAGMYVDTIDGSYSNVVGLPMSALRDMLIEISEN